MKVSPNQIEIKTGTIEEVVQLSQQILEFQNPHGIEEYERRLLAVPYLILIAFVDGEAAGFKVGYEKMGDFYSWMGAILPKYRRLGLATKMAESQEAWAVKQGYPHVTFKTRNYLKPMLIFALQRGFHILAVEEREQVEEYRIVLRKNLSNARTIA